MLQDRISQIDLLKLVAERNTEVKQLKKRNAQLEQKVNRIRKLLNK